MKILTALLLSLSCCILQAQTPTFSTGDIRLSKKAASGPDVPVKLTPAASSFWAFDAGGNPEPAAASANGRSLVAAANYSAMKALLDLEIGTDVQAWDTDLDAWATVTPSANGKSLVSAADYAAMRTLLGLLVGTDVQAWDTDLDAWATVTPSANGKSLVSAADYAAMRTLLGLVIGTNVQAWDPDLDTWATVTPSVNGKSLVSAADYAAMKTLLSLNNVENTALSTWAGSANITTVGTISTGTWSASTIAVNKGGTGQTSYTDGQLLIGKTDGSLAKATLTAGANVTVTNSDGGVTIAASSSSMPRSYLAGLKLSNNGADATNDIDIAAGAARDSTNAEDLFSVGLTKRLDAAWAVGTNAGGLDTGSIADTTYHVWLIKRSDTGVVDALFSTSVSAPTMPANYDYKRRIGSIVRAGATILAFIQDGDRFILVTPVLDVNDATLTTSRKTYTLASVPTGLRLWVWGNVYTTSATATNKIWISDLSTTDSAPSESAAPLAQSRQNGVSAGLEFQVQFMTNSSAQFGVRAGNASTTFMFATHGWVDRRGRDD